MKLYQLANAAHLCHIFAMSKTAAVHSRIDPHIKNEAESVLNQLGMKPSEAIQVFYKQIALRQAFPLELKLPNVETQRVLEESSRGVNVKSFETKEELFEDLGL